MHSLYIHIPFCDKKCFYCSFVVTVGQLKRSDQYVDALKKEAALYKGTRIKSVYLGGGTPTTLTINQFENLVNFINKNFALDSNFEFTVEANPEGLDLQKLRALKDLGVNRISLGIQTFQDHFLKYLGRIHDRKKAVDSYALIRQAGFKNVSCDLMISFPEQSLEQLTLDLDEMMSLSAEHISLYSLTIEPNSRFYAKKILLLEEKMQTEHYQRVVDVTQKNGFERYEVSNFARTGYESVHNINYWECGDYIGLGIGAHSHIQGKRFQNVDKLGDYLKMADDDQFQPTGLERLDVQQRLTESVLFGLRMTRGVNIEKIQERFGCQWDDQRRNLIEDFIQEGLLTIEGEYLKTTNRGMMVLDELCSRLY